MFPRRFSKIYLNASVHNWLLGFSAKPSLNTRPRLLHCVRCTATPASHPVCDPVPGSQKRGLYFVEYLLNNADTYCVVNTNNINLEEETNFDSLKLLKDFINHSELTEIPEDLMHVLKKELSRYSLEEIYKYIILTSNCNSWTHCIELMGHLSNELLSRKLSLEDRLKILFVISERKPGILTHKSFRFSSLSLLRLCTKITKLNPQQAVQVMFAMVNLNSKSFKFPFQQYFADIIPQLNSDELGMVARGFVNGKISFSHKQLPFVILNKAMEEIENFQAEPFNNLCKLFFLSLRPPHGDLLLNFQEKVIPHIPKLTLKNIVYLAKTGEGIRCMNPSLWEILANIFKKNIDNFTIDEIDSMVNSATANNITDDELLHLAIKRFETEDNVPHSYLISFLYHLTLHKLYPENLLSVILSNKFRSEVNLGNFYFNTKYRYCFINCCVELDKPMHNFELLDSETRKPLLKVFKIFNYRDTLWDTCQRANKDIRRVLQNNYGGGSVFYTECLPHFGAGLVMRFNKILEAQSIPEEFKQSESYYAKKAPKDDHIWIFIILVTFKDLLLNSKTPTLKLQTQIRQLKSIGYKPVLVNLLEWNNHLDTGNKFEFIRNEIIKTLEELLEKKSE